MKHLFCVIFIFSIFATMSLMHEVAADEADKATSQSSVTDDEDYYSPPLGGEGCSTPVPVS